MNIIYIYIYGHIGLQTILYRMSQTKPFCFFQAGSVSGLNPTPWGAALDGLAKFRPVLPRCDGDCGDQMVGDQRTSSCHYRWGLTVRLSR